ncbi:MAG: hypothetical protein AAFW64_05250 [Pseudomonadota bacterium]
MRSIEETVRSVVGSDVLARVNIQEDRGRDGEKLVIVDIVYHEASGSIDADAMQTITDRVWAIAETKYVTPVISFISSLDVPLEAAE